MKLKKVLSGFLSAAILATTTAIVMPLNAVAADVELSTSSLSYTDLQKYESLTFTYEPSSASSCDHSAQHTNGETYCPWAQVAIIGALENTGVEISDSKKTDWYQPDTPASASSGKDESPTSATIKVSAILNAFTNDSDWQETYTLSSIQYQGWGATITKVVGTPKSGDAPVLKPVNVTIDEAEVEIPKNAWDQSNPENYNYQGTYTLEVEGYTAESDTIADIDISTLTVKFPVASVTCNGETIDPADVSYQINVKVHKGDDWSPWLTGGSSSYNSTTKMVTVTADIENMIAGTDTDYVLNSFNLVAMVDKSKATDTVILKIGDEVAVESVSLDETTLSLKKGETATLTATVEPAGAAQDVVWTSANEGIATVENGTVTALKAGETTITATAGGKSATCSVTVTAKAEDPKPDTKAYTLNVVDASGWGEAGVTKAAQVNVPVTTLNGFTVGTTTYKDVKSKTLKLENLGFGSCTAAGVNAENVDVCIYLQFGSGWTWCATGGNTLADGFVEYDLSTLANNGVKDADVLQAIGFQFNIKGNAGGINDMALDAKVTLNAAEPKFTVVGEEPPAEDSDYDTGRVETVDDYVPANAGTELVVKSITAAEAARYDSYTITVTDNNGKSYTTTTSDCYKAFKYNTASGEKTEEAAGFFIIVKVTNVPAGTTVSVTIEPTV